MAISFSDAEQENELITRSTALPEDAGEGSLRPRYLNEYIGQERAKENLRIFIQAAKMRGKRLTTSFSTALPDSEKRRSPPLSPTRWP